MQNGARLNIHSCVLFVLIIATGALVSGCGKDKNEVKYRVHEGRVADINQETGVFEGWFYSKKQKQEIKRPGRLDPNVEILINGVIAAVDDVRIDDKVRVEAKEIRRGSEREFIVTKVEVTRMEEEPRPAASAPQPANPEP